MSADQEDLISIGTIGLIKGITTFDASKGARLATYAARCVENEVLMYFRSQRKSSQDVSLSDYIETGADGAPLALMDVVSQEDDLLEQVDNRQRVRFLYIEYMLKRVRSGYMIRRQMTPDEIAEELLLEEDERVIFSTYDEARYAKDPEISDATVGKIMALTKRRQEIRKERFD